MREGGLEAPKRNPIDWTNAEFHDLDALDREMRRVFDICHSCRRCYRLCDSFPRLFELIDGSPTGELDSVDSSGFKRVVDACTLCDICFMASCPYVPPHEFNVDFPHLMLRYRAAHLRREGAGFGERLITETDRNGRMGCRVAPLANWALDTENRLSRPVMERLAGVDREAELPRYQSRTLVEQASGAAPPVNREAPAFGRKAVLYATCYGNYNGPSIGLAARAVLARNGVETAVVHPRCCGMPQLEQGDLVRVAEHARTVTRTLLGWVDKGFDVIALVPSCALMLKFEWPLILPGDGEVARLAGATFDVAEYVVGIAAEEGLAPGLKPLDAPVTLHIACHARAQNMSKAAELLGLVPEARLTVIERCSGHGGSWGARKGNFETALKVGRPVARQAQDAGRAYLASECPLAGVHIRQGMERLAVELGGQPPAAALHPIELFARAYGL